MYCIKCGAHLADTEKKCPLCETEVYHSTLKQEPAEPLYPIGKMPRSESGRAVLGGAIIILFMIPLLLTFFSDFLVDHKIDWFGFVAGGMVCLYVILALPLWFKAPNPVIFIPCDFAAIALNLFYVCLATDGSWFFPFALPITAGLALVVCTPVTLLRYVKRGRLFILGGSIMGLGALPLAVELLMIPTFGIPFMGWSVFPLITLFLLGGLMIYLAINATARESVERKLFF